MGYLESLLNNSKDMAEDIAESVERIKTKTIGTNENGDGTLKMSRLGEIIVGHWLNVEDRENVRMRAKLYYSSAGAAIVERLTSEIRKRYGDVQVAWVDNSDGVAAGFADLIERFTLGDLSKHLPAYEDLEDPEAEVTDFNGKYFVDITHFLKVVDGVVQWGEFRAHAGQWKLEGELLIPTVLGEYPVQDSDGQQ